MTIEDLAGSTAERMRAQLDARPNAYGDFEHHIMTTIRVLETLKRLIELGRPHRTHRDLIAATRCQRQIESAVALMARVR